MEFSRRIIARFMLASSLALALPLAALADGGACRPAAPGGLDGLAGPEGLGGHGQPPCGGPRAAPGEPMPPFLRRLKLSEAQRDKIFEILHAQAPALRDKEKETRKAAEALRELTLSAKYDDAKARALADASAKAMAEAALLRARSGNAIYQVLTPEQRKTLEERKAETQGEDRDELRPAPPAPPRG